jgi:hypothetical protein
VGTDHRERGPVELRPLHASAAIGLATGRVSGLFAVSRAPAAGSPLTLDRVECRPTVRDYTSAVAAALDTRDCHPGQPK